MKTVIILHETAAEKSFAYKGTGYLLARSVADPDPNCQFDTDPDPGLNPEMELREGENCSKDIGKI